MPVTFRSHKFHILNAAHLSARIISHIWTFRFWSSIRKLANFHKRSGAEAVSPIFEDGGDPPETLSSF